MKFTLFALVSLGLGQPPAPDYHAQKSRTFKLPIEYTQDRKTIRQMQLYVSRDQGMTWHQEAEQPPTQDAFVYAAPADGVYWFNMVVVDLKGKRNPPDLTKEPPALKAIVDTVPPQVRFTNAKRNGEEVVVEWVIDDKFPDDNATRVFFRAAGASDALWQEVALPAGVRNGVRFPSGTVGPVVVRVTAQDLAKNTNEGLREIPAAGTPTTPPPPAGPSPNTTPTAPTPPAPPLPADPAPTRTAMLPPPINVAPEAPASPVGYNPTLPAGPVAPPPPAATPYTPPPGPSVPQAPTTPMNVVTAQLPAPTPLNVVSTQAPGPPPPVGPSPTGVYIGTQATPPAPTPDARQPVTPGVQTGTPSGGPTPLPVWTGSNAALPIVEMSRVQVTNRLRFDLSYQIDQKGPSGIGRVDLWVTRDDGQTWVKWGQHDDTETPIRVVLDTGANTALEGLYGFRLVPVSRAGLSEREPARGDTPDMRVVVDVTSPVVELYDPVSNPGARDTLVLRWKATDRNFGTDPITLEWAEKPTGPWHPIVVGGENRVVQANAMPGVVRGVPNTGSYPWRVPDGVPARVYIKVTARDAGGNLTEAITQNPMLIDLAIPRAKIQGIVPVAGRP